MQSDQLVIETNRFMLRQALLNFLLVSLGLFLFILFFKPIGFEPHGIDNALLQMLGYAGICYILLIVCVILPSIIYPNHLSTPDSFLALFSFVVLNTVSDAFYVRYVGAVHLTMFLIFKILLLSIGIAVIIWLIYRYQDLMKQLQRLRSANIALLGDVHTPHGKAILSFGLVGANDHLEIEIDQLLCVASCGNYVEIFQWNGKNSVRHVVRDTMKNIEENLVPHPQIIRCHRAFLVNMDHAISLSGRVGGYRLSLNHLEQDLPVSRQHIVDVRKWMTSKMG